MRIDVITLFPDFVEKLREYSVLGRAIGESKVELVTHNLRDWAVDKYGSVDDRPYGGGPGMVLRVDILVSCLTAVKKMAEPSKVILLTPQGRVLQQAFAKELAKEQRLILICGHYEGFDERIREYVDLELSIGDYVLTGGELAAQVVIDSVVRLLPGVLGDDESSLEESFTHSAGSGQAILEYPQYTRPQDFEGKRVPEILLNGNHKEIEKWRQERAVERTKIRRPDLDLGSRN